MSVAFLLRGFMRSGEAQRTWSRVISYYINPDPMTVKTFFCSDWNSALSFNFSLGNRQNNHFFKKSKKQFCKFVIFSPFELEFYNFQLILLCCIFGKLSKWLKKCPKFGKNQTKNANKTADNGKIVKTLGKRTNSLKM